jgi:glycine cleavage system aminomethyltransferase T
MNGEKNKPVALPHFPALPFDPDALSYVNWQQYLPHTHTDWREETLSWKNSCYIAAELSAFPQVKLIGPDVLKLLSRISVNSFVNFPIGSIKHMINCTEDGNIAFHGLVFRLADDIVSVHADAFYIEYHIDKSKDNVKTELDALCTYQLGGPRSLEIVEQAAQEDLHDIQFMRFRSAVIAGHKVRVTRMGMAGTLAYEVHAFTIEDGLDVYNELMRVGKPLGLVRLGINAYMSNHTENGYPQIHLHFPGTSKSIKEYVDFLSKKMFQMRNELMMQPDYIPRGTLSANIQDYYRNPYELDWGHMVKFDHDFIGRNALEKIAKNHRKMVTLVWNHEDMMKVFASFFEKGEEPYPDMAFPQEMLIKGVFFNKFFSYKVLKDGKTVGAAMWRTYTLYYRETLSLCCIDPEYSEIGTDVTILYGDVGTRTIEIRAKVERYPYLDLTPNYKFDVETIPHYKR